MRILHISTTDIKGGAGIAAYRLHKGLINNGIESIMFVQRKYGKADDVLCSKNKFWKLFDLLCFLADKTVASIFGHQNYEITSPALFASMDISIIDKINPDIVHIHWICGGFLSPEKIKKIKRPIIWTMHDMWPFLGINHYNSHNNDCPNDDNLLDKWTWKRKEKSWNNLNDLITVAPSRWLAKEARSSKLFGKVRIENIPNGINVNIFKIYDKLSSRKKYGLPSNKKILLFGGVNPLSAERKGYKLLSGVIEELSKSSINKDLALVVFGSTHNNKLNFNLPTYYVGKISSEKDLAEIYSAADIFIAPSIEDNLPNTVIESMSCGTPVVAFNIGGMSDMIEDKINGIIVNPFDNVLMAKEIVTILNDVEYQKKMSTEARKKVLKEFDINLVANKYRQVYKTILRK